ncbi:MAG: Cof-type HAD-IIB family hydrolase [Ruminiclostridium sp.]|nr:Cof-type HAD-IIB family hydrolase [Ruminiclostridium sp.]
MTLYVSDLDGTLLNNAGKLAPRAADMLNCMTAGGTLFSYCTARGLMTAGKITGRLKLTAPVALMNGVFIYDPLTDTYPVRNVFGAAQAELVKRAVTGYGETPMIFSVIGGRERVSFVKGADNLKKHISGKRGDPRLRPIDGYDGLFDGEMFYAAFINPKNKPELDKLFTPENGFAYSYYTDTYDTSQQWYEVFSASAGKSGSVLKLKELTGADEVVCFGDNANDIPMFRAADRCYAVGNAIPELKELADGVIGTNEECGVPEFIQGEVFPRFAYEPPMTDIDEERFELSVRKALERERTTIGTLNEKLIHHTLKCYYCDDPDQEVKIGGFFADGVGESGIFEIQSGSFGYLQKKLSQMLRVSHVTVVYPYAKKTHSYSINAQTGEVLSSVTRTDNSFSKLFLELYRLKAFITNPNLTIRIAFLEIDRKTYFRDSSKRRTRGMKKDKFPLALLREIRLERGSDYRVFLPEGLPDEFTREELQKLCRPTDASLMLSVLEFVGVVRRSGKRGRALLYSVVPDGSGQA